MVVLRAEPFVVEGEVVRVVGMTVVVVDAVVEVEFVPLTGVENTVVAVVLMFAPVTGVMSVVDTVTFSESVVPFVTVGSENAMVKRIRRNSSIGHCTYRPTLEFCPYSASQKSHTVHKRNVPRYRYTVHIAIFQLALGNQYNNNNN